MLPKLEFLLARNKQISWRFLFVEEYAQFYGAMTMNREHMVNMRKDGLPYEEMGYSGPPPNRCLVPPLVKWTMSVSCHYTLFRKLPPVPGTNSNYNTIDRIKKGKCSDFVSSFKDGMPKIKLFSLLSWYFICTQSGQTLMSIIFECFMFNISVIFYFQFNGNIPVN